MNESIPDELMTYQEKAKMDQEKRKREAEELLSQAKRRLGEVQHPLAPTTSS